MSAELNILEPPPAPVYYCPGETAPVSQAIHRARQAARWPGCQHCSSRDLPATADSMRRTALIRRTEWGVRGAWQNALTRLTAVQLTGVVTGHLQSLQELSAADSAADAADSRIRTDIPDPVTVISGYDSRPSSPDIYAGVVLAALQNGCHVIDAGRTTAAHLQELCRSGHTSSYGILVTGAGEPQAFSGFDLFDRAGQAVSIPWQSWGVEIRRVSTGSDNSAETNPDGREAIARLQHSMSLDELSEYPGSANVSHPGDCVSALIMPAPTSSSGARFRTSRRSGSCRTIEAEDTYREWLTNWFPTQLQSPPVCLCFDPLTAERLIHVLDALGADADILPAVTSRSVEKQLSQRVRETRAAWGICIGEDDRFMTLADSFGRCLSARQLSAWMNETIQTTRAHVTTHVPANENRVVMLDAGRPGQGAAHDVISDAIALTGCVSRIIESGIALPRSG